MSTESTQAEHPDAAINPVSPIAPIVPIHLPTLPTSTPLSTASPTVSTAAPTSSVSVTVPNTLGTVTFSLVVTDNLGVQSQPAFATLTIQGAPVAVLAATPATVTEGGAIELSGAGSTSSGSITNYTFSLVPAATPIPSPVT
jgi:hypothetical protein